MEAAETKMESPRWGIYRPVFLPSAILIGAFVVASLTFSEEVGALFGAFQGVMNSHLGWMVNGTINLILLLVLFLAFSPLGKVRIGGTQASPDFSTLSWVAMLFAAGMGIGLVYFSVAEPMLHFLNPIDARAPDADKAARAMQFTYFHYGFHVWAIYALVGIALAHACFNRKQPLSLRSTLQPILGRYVDRWPGHAVDVLAVLATLFGLATSLGFGSGQFSAGLARIGGFENSTALQVACILGITGIATVSVLSGLSRGVRMLSQFNMGIAALLFLTVLFLGATGDRLLDFASDLGQYFSGFAWMSTFRGTDNPDAAWISGWSLFYWTWWISWSPFVGTFIARISKGRTVREIALYGMLLPSFLSFLWMSVFGGTAFALQFSGQADIAATVTSDSALGLFAVLEQLPAAGITSAVAVLLVGVFFVTSSDSGSMVVDFMTSGGRLDSPVGLKVFWACMEGAVAIALVMGGGLAALQSASISTGFPFAILLLIIGGTLVRSLRKERALQGKPDPD